MAQWWNAGMQGIVEKLKAGRLAQNQKSLGSRWTSMRMNFFHNSQLLLLQQA